MLAQRKDQGERLILRDAGSARFLRDQRIKEAGSGKRAPDRLPVQASFGDTNGLRRHSAGNDAAKGIGEVCGFFLHRRPSPRAIMPRNISRVPPRSENTWFSCMR